MSGGGEEGGGECAIPKRIWDVFVVHEMDFAVMLKLSFLIFVRHQREFMSKSQFEIIECCQSRACLQRDGAEDDGLILNAGKLRIRSLCLAPMRVSKGAEEEKERERDGEEDKPLESRFWAYFKMLVAMPK